jgi:manganese-dependent ADP-ribose/CDP-alcohol diphosphatase
MTSNSNIPASPTDGGLLFAFGVVADVQYEDRDDGGVEGRRQRYREAPQKLRSALQHFIKMQNPSPHFILNLGDIINGNRPTEEENLKDFDLISTCFEEELGPPTNINTFHVLGNHCLGVPRQVLSSRLHIQPPYYYSTPIAPGWRLIVLDTTEMSGHSNMDPDSPAVQEALAYRQAHPLSEEANPQMSDWNGGITSAQMEWLKQQLAAAEAGGERVVVACHHQVGAGAARDTHMAWNHGDIRNVLVSSPAFVLGLAGHDHLGGYSSWESDAEGDEDRSDGSIGEKGRKHFVTVEALLEAPSGSNAYAVVLVHKDRIEIQGHGTVTSRVMEF